MFSYTSIILLALAGCLLLGFIVKIKGQVDGGPAGVLMLSAIGLAFFAPAVLYVINPEASTHDLLELSHKCPKVEFEIDLFHDLIRQRDLTKLYSDCKPSLI